MLAAISLILVVIAFGVIGLFTDPISTTRLVLLMVTTVLLVAFSILEAKYQKPPKVMFRRASVPVPAPVFNYWPIGFVLATMAWMIAPQTGLFVLILATAYAAIAVFRLYKSRSALRADAAAIRTEMRSQPYELIVHSSGPPDAAYQVNQWLPVLEQLPFNTAIVVRDGPLARAIEKTTLPIIIAEQSESVAQIVDAGVRTILYPANGMKNAHVLRHTDCTHVFINHGESDKVVNQSKFLMAYDRLFVGGQLAKDRLIDAGLPIRDDQVVFVGRPQAEMALSKRSGDGPLKTVLYAPTWEGFTEVANFGSVRDMGFDILNSLASRPGLDVVFKPHPMTGSRCAKTKAELKKINALCAQRGITVLTSRDSIHAAMNQSDLMITDVSSVLNEYLITDKPVILCDPFQNTPEELGTTYPSSRAAYLLQNAAALRDLVQSISEHDPMAAQRASVRSYSLGDYPQGALEEFKSRLADVM